jgi:methylated-DNA-[protein]-cysteine S-methyltransferase
MSECYIETPLGIVKIEGDKQGVSAVSLLNSQESITVIIPEELEDCVHQLTEYFEGSRTTFNLKLNPHGTDFQKRVWGKLLDIPFGSTLSYLELSKQLGNVKAIRAVAGANGKNPLGIIVPCHRVIGSDGALTGYAGGLYRKQWLLEHENPNKQQSLF